MERNGSRDVTQVGANITSNGVVTQHLRARDRSSGQPPPNIGCSMNPKPAESRRADATTAFSQIAEDNVTHAQLAYDKVGTASAESADFIKNGYSTAIAGIRDYNNKLLEFAHANTNATLEFVQRLSRVKSPSEFIVLSSEHARKQFETLTEQARQLATLAQKVTLATGEPIKTAVAKVANQ
jgi:phasin